MNVISGNSILRQRRHFNLNILYTHIYKHKTKIDIFCSFIQNKTDEADFLNSLLIKFAIISIKSYLP